MGFLRVGSKGQPRRKVIKKPKGFTATGGPAGDDKKLQAALKKLNVQPMIGMEEVNMFKDEGSKILHFSNPKGTKIYHQSISSPLVVNASCADLIDVPHFRN